MIDEVGKQMGVVATPDALRLAQERTLDLVLVSPSANPPVARIADYGKLKYEMTKKEKEARKGQRGGTLKEVKLSPKIATHDYDVRVRKTRELLEKKHKVKVSMFFKGREMSHSELGLQVMNRLVDELADIGKVEEAPKRLGKNIFIVMAPK